MVFLSRKIFFFILLVLSSYQTSIHSIHSLIRLPNLSVSYWFLYQCIQSNLLSNWTEISTFLEDMVYFGHCHCLTHYAHCLCDLTFSSNELFVQSSTKHSFNDRQFHSITRSIINSTDCLSTSAFDEQNISFCLDSRCQCTIRTISTFLSCFTSLYGFP